MRYHNAGEEIFSLSVLRKTQLCGCWSAGVLAVHAKAAPAALVPHLQAIASQTQQLWDAGLLRPGERCVLSETLVIAAAGSTPDIQKQVQQIFPLVMDLLYCAVYDHVYCCDAILCWPN